MMTSTAKEALLTFINLMKNFEIHWVTVWESYCPDNVSSFNENEEKKMIHELNEIFDKSLSKKALSLSQGRLMALCMQSPPEYNQEIINERKISNKKYEFLVKENKDFDRKYIVILEDGLWKIDSLFILDDGKWRRCSNQF